ncbi:MAG: T9SS type A sorting domain-containing protein, partial [Bacteroidota bacterium]
TGLEDELSFESIQLFPNPAKDKLYFQFRSSLLNEPNSDLTLYNLSGQSVRKASYPTAAIGENRFELSLDGLSSGLYMLEFRNGKRRITRQVSVQ